MKDLVSTYSWHTAEDFPNASTWSSSSCTASSQRCFFFFFWVSQNKIHTYHMIMVIKEGCGLPGLR